MTLIRILGEALQYRQSLHIYSRASLPHSVLPLPVPQSHTLLPFVKSTLH